jgi:hypothetical protein
MNVKEMSLENQDASEKQVQTKKNEFSDDLLKLMQNGNEQFQKDKGRPMTYLEMRQMYG